MYIINFKLEEANMLFIVDMQNNYLDEEKGKMYVPNAENLISGVIEKIKEIKKKDECIFYTLDIYAERESHLLNRNDIEDVREKLRNTSEIEEWNCQLHPKLKPYLEDGQYIKKSHYAIPPERLLELQQRFNDEKRIIREIEFVGVETHICVLSNAVAMRAAFPDAKIIINSRLTKSVDYNNHKRALEVMEALKMEIRR